MARIDFVTGNAQRYLPDVEAIAVVPERVEDALAGRSDTELRRARAEGEWSAEQVLRHLVAYVQRDRGHFFRMAWQNDPIFPAFDEEAHIHAHGLDAMGAAALVEALTEVIAGSVEVLIDLPDASWGRPGWRPGDGRQSIRQRARASGAHYHEHIDQLRQAVGRP